jgi:hypothetical protein
MCKSLFMFAVLAVSPVIASAQIALVHASACGPQAFPTSGCTISSTGSGNLIVVGIQLGKGVSTSTTIATITDNAGNAYQEATGATSARSVDSSGGTVVDIWYARNSQAGATSLTISPSTTISTASAFIWEFSGINTTAPLDQVGVLNSQTTGILSLSGAPVTTTNYASEIVISLAAESGIISGISSGNAFSNDSTLNNGGWAHLITSVTGTFTPQWALSVLGSFASSTVSFRAANAAPAFSACDLSQDRAVNVIDVQLAINMTPGVNTLACSPSINVAGLGVCNNLVVQQIEAAALPPNVCTTASGHSVLLNWAASSTSGVNYNVYRSTTSGGPYTKLTAVTPVAGLGYIDSTVFSGQTYYYVVTAVNSSGESGYSSESTASVPFP